MGSGILEELENGSGKGTLLNLVLDPEHEGDVMNRRTDDSLQQEFLAGLQQVMEEDTRIVAAWLEGSYGRRRADRYSDLDIHLLLDRGTLAGFQSQVEGWLNRIRPLVLFRSMFDGKMANGLTREGLRLDLWMHETQCLCLNPNQVLVLADPGRRLLLDRSALADDPDEPQLEAQMREFWRCISLLPSVIGRGERISGFMGLTVELQVLNDILIRGHGMRRTGGAKEINRFLPDDVRTQIEAALDQDGLREDNLVAAHWRLAAILQRYGPDIAARHGFNYPVELESAVLDYVERELRYLGFAPWKQATKSAEDPAASSAQ